MEEPRLKARLRVQAMLRQQAAAGCLGVVVRTGDADAGSLLLVLRSREGLAIFTEARDGQGRAAWLRIGGNAPLAEAAADEQVARQVHRDPDLWVVEFESLDLSAAFAGRLLG